jgi:hypothetical protein
MVLDINYNSLPITRHPERVSNLRERDYLWRTAVISKLPDTLTSKTGISKDQYPICHTLHSTKQSTDY